jgi:hypothetical protein
MATRRKLPLIGPAVYRNGRVRRASRQPSPWGAPRARVLRWRTRGHMNLSVRCAVTVAGLGEWRVWMADCLAVHGQRRTSYSPRQSAIDLFPTISRGPRPDRTRCRVWVVLLVGSTPRRAGSAARDMDMEAEQSTATICALIADGERCRMSQEWIYRIRREQITRDAKQHALCAGNNNATLEGSRGHARLNRSTTARK